MTKIIRFLFFNICMTVIFGSNVNAVVIKDSLTVAPFGKIHLYIPEGTPGSLTIMISGDEGWRYGILNFSEHFASQNSLVIGVDIRSYYRNLKNRTEKCYHIVSDFVMMATYIEKKYNFPHYKEPFLMGYSSGATLVYALLAQARPDTFKGGISLGFCPDVELPKHFCELNGLKEKPVTEGKSFYLDPDSHLGNRWIVLQGKLDHTCDFQETSVFIDQSAAAELIELDRIGHGFSKWSDFMPEWDKAFKSLLIQDKTVHEFKSLASGDTSVVNLPFTATKATTSNENAPMVLFISGDGGWYSFEQDLSDHLAEMGVPVAGLDAKKYFWNRRTPQESAQDITRLLNHFSEIWQKDKFILMGYSMGAEVLPFIYEQLSENIKEKVENVILLSPDEHADFEIHITNMMGIGNSHNTFDVGKELIKISHEVPILIITGKSEDSPFPSILSSTNIQFETVPGDHHYNNDSFVIANVLKKDKILP